MNYYNEIKLKLIDTEIIKKVKINSIERNRVKTYFEIGKLLNEAGKKYGESIIEKYSEKLMLDIGKKYTPRSLRSMRQLYVNFNDEFWKPVVSKLSWTNILILMPLKNINKIYYYANQCIKYNLSKRELQKRIKSHEYERLDCNTKNKLIAKDKTNVTDYIKNPIIIKNNNNYEVVKESILKQLILEDLDNFLIELGDGFCYIKSEYKIKIGNNYNYVDLLLYNIEFNCYVVVELKVTELKKEHIGQIEVYMNYIDKNIKGINQDKTIGLIIVKKDNKYILEYSSDSRIVSKEYKIE